jgi:hypothetical protein
MVDANAMVIKLSEAGTADRASVGGKADVLGGRFRCLVGRAGRLDARLVDSVCS